jgi:hypothetical protein
MDKLEPIMEKPDEQANSNRYARGNQVHVSQKYPIHAVDAVLKNSFSKN